MRGTNMQKIILKLAKQSVKTVELQMKTHQMKIHQLQCRSTGCGVHTAHESARPARDVR